jgi:hypothetical protein
MTDQLERVLRDALRAADGPVDLLGARTRLTQHVAQRKARRAALQRRLAVAAVVVAVLSVALAIPLITGHDRSGPPVEQPRRQLAPSGLPVGILTGTLDLAPTGGEGITSMRLVVRADGSGEYRAWDGGSAAAGSAADAYEVALAKVASGRAVLLYDDAGCPQRSQLTLDFTLGAGTVRITRAQTADCLVSNDLAAGLTGSELRIRPLTAAQRRPTREISPSGLPVGLLKAFVQAGTPPVDKYVQLVVRADGTGVFNQGNSNHSGEAFNVGLRATATGRVAVRYDSPAPSVCPDHVAFMFTFTETKSSVLVDQTEPGCLLPNYLATAMTGLVLQRLPLPGP